MKGFRYILFILALLVSVGMRGQYNPTNPAEPGTYYTLTLQTTPSNGGSFNLSTTTTHTEGTKVSLRAYTNTNYQFVGWELDGEVVSTSSSFTYTMPARNVKLIAHYKYNPSSPAEPTEPDIPVYSKLYLSANPSGAGSFNINSGNKYEVGTSVYVRAYTNSSYTFKNWTEDGEVISTSASFNYLIKKGDSKLVANYEYTPSNPAEPSEPKIYHKLYLKANPSGGGYFNIDSGNGYEEGASVYLRAYNNQWYSFQNWTDENGDVVSENSSFYYNMPGVNKTLTANYTYYYNPSGPNEPNEPNIKDVNIYGMTENGVRGQTITYPVYLENALSVKEIKVDIQFPIGFGVDTEDIRLAGRASGHDIEVTDLGDNNYRFYISGTDAFIGNNGKMFDLMVSIPDTATMGMSYPVLLTHGVMFGMDDSQTPISVRNGNIYVEKVSEDGLYAKFSIDKLQGRVKFTNLSSGNAKSYTWDFGDGTTSTEKSPLHIYAKSGYYVVKLSAKGEVDEDVAEMTILINDESTWKVEGTFYLSDEVSGVRYFTTAESLFNFVNSSTISNNVKVAIKADGTYTYPLTPANIATLQSIQSSLASNSFTLTLNKFGNGRNPVLSLGEKGGTIIRDIVDGIVGLGKNLVCEGVEMQMWGLGFNPAQIWQIQSQRIHSGEKTSEVDFSHISSDLNFSWTLASQPEGVSGYVTSGSGSIPSMNIVNEGVGDSELVYNIKGTSSGNTVCEFTNVITVTPALVGLFNTLSPADGYVSESTTVSLSWNSITNAVYDVYLWNAVNQRPSTPVLKGTSELRYTSQNFCQNGNTYKWQIVARNESQELASDTMSFAVRSLPNLHVYALDCSEAQGGEKFTVEWTVKNDGVGSTGNVEWNDYIWLVNDVYAGTVNGTSTNNARLLATVKNVKALESGESYQNSIDLTLDKTIMGNCYVIVAADMYSITDIEWSTIGGSVINPYNPSADGSTYKHLYAKTSASYNKVFEQDETTTRSDNFFYKKIEVKVPLLPDLQVPSVTAQVLPTQDPVLGSAKSLGIHGDLGYLYDEDNNMIYSWKECYVPTPISAAGLRGSNAWYSGKKVAVSVTVANKGGEETKDPFNMVLYLSSSAERDAAPLTAFASKTCKKNILPGEETTMTIVFYLPYDWYGDTYFHAYADINDDVMELANTVNNWGCSDKVEVLLCPGADFVPNNLVAPKSITSSSPFNISYKVDNKGAGIPFNYAWEDRVYLSRSDKGIDNSAVLVGSLKQTARFSHSIATSSTGAPDGGSVIIAPEQYTFSGDNYSRSVNIDPSKLTDGTYYVYVQVDARNTVFEFNGEENNILRSDPITVKNVAPDLSVELLSVSEDTLSTGREIAFSWKLKNTGTGDIKDAKITDTFYATVNMDGTGGTKFATVENTVWIAAGAEKTLHANIRIPSNSSLDGLRYIYMKTNENNGLSEISSSNNKSGALKSWCKYVADPVNTTPTTRGVNLTVSNISISNTVKPGEPVTMTYVVRNNGDTDMGDVEVSQEVFVSSSYSFSESNSVKCEVTGQKGSCKKLKAGGAVTISLTVTVPSSVKGGSKYLYAIADRGNTLNEKKTDDNVGRTSVAISGNMSDLKISDYVLADTIMTSQNVTLKFTTSNVGEWDAGNTTSRIYLSNDNEHNYNDRELTSVPVGAIQKGATVESTATFCVSDKQAGKWYILISTDANGQENEMNENNNLTAIPVTIIQSPLPDLSVSELSTDEELTSGKPMKIRSVVKNLGQSATRSSKWSDTYYLSPSTVLNTSTATKIGSKAHVGALGVGDSYTNEVSFTIPSTLQGNFMLFVVTDATDAITESDENNNSRCIPVYVNSSADTPAELTISNVNAPANIKAGEDVTISYRITNDGEFTGAGNLHDVIYLSKDDKWDLNDEMVGVVSGNMTIAPGNTVTRSVTGRITNMPEGNYYVIVKTNSTKSIAEKSDDNNTAVMKSPVKLSFNTITLGSSSSVNTSGYYKLEVPSGYDGKTVGFYLNHPEDASAGLYAAYEKVPSTAKYDFAASKLLETQQEVLIPNAKAGSYYILAQDNAALVNGTGNVFSEKGSSVSGSTQMTLDAKEVHFGATTLSISEGGNGGWVSTDINGALFDSIMDFRLQLDNTVIPAEAVTFNGMTKSRVTFNLNSATVGSYDVVSELPDGTQASLPNGFKVIPGASVALGAKIDAPSVVRVGSYAPLSVTYANGGNTDCEIYDLILVLDNGYLGTTIQDLDKHQSVLHLEVDSESDSRGYKAIPPGTQKTINLFMYQTTNLSNLTIYVIK